MDRIILHKLRVWRLRYRERLMRRAVARVKAKGKI